MLLLGRYGKQDGSRRLLPKISREALAEMAGTTRSRVNVFLSTFKKPGFVDYNGGITADSSLVSVVLRDWPPVPAGRRPAAGRILPMICSAFCPPARRCRATSVQ